MVDIRMLSWCILPGQQSNIHSTQPAKPATTLQVYIPNDCYIFENKQFLLKASYRAKSCQTKWKPSWKNKHAHLPQPLDFIVRCESWIQTCILQTVYATAELIQQLILSVTQILHVNDLLSIKLMQCSVFFEIYLPDESKK